MLLMLLLEQCQLYLVSEDAMLSAQALSSNVAALGNRKVIEKVIKVAQDPKCELLTQ